MSFYFSFGAQFIALIVLYTQQQKGDQAYKELLFSVYIKIWFPWEIPSSVTIAIESTAEKDFHHPIWEKELICFFSMPGGQNHVFLMSNEIRKISK